jgi:hypothetical protein
MSKEFSSTMQISILCAGIRWLTNGTQIYIGLDTLCRLVENRSLISYARELHGRWYVCLAKKSLDSLWDWWCTECQFLWNSYDPNTIHLKFLWPNTTLYVGIFVLFPRWSSSWWSEHVARVKGTGPQKPRDQPSLYHSPKYLKEIHR